MKNVSSVKGHHQRSASYLSLPATFVHLSTNRMSGTRIDNDRKMR